MNAIESHGQSTVKVISFYNFVTLTRTKQLFYFQFTLNIFYCSKMTVNSINTFFTFKTHV